MIHILILAAGSSSRMKGRDKLLEPVDGTPQLRRITQMADATGRPVTVALPQNDHLRKAALKDVAVTQLNIPDAHLGIATTLRRSMAALPALAPVMVVLADLVELETEDLRIVLSAAAAHPDQAIVRGATHTGAPGHPIVFHPKLRGHFATLSGDTGAQSIAKSFAKDTLHVPLPDDRARLDLDTPKDWAAWRARTNR